jgi:hypothetical protein
MAFTLIFECPMLTLTAPDGKTELDPCSQCLTKVNEPSAINLEALVPENSTRSGKGK